MNPAVRRELNAARYRALAAAAESARDGASLEQVRARHADAAQRWTALADGEDLQNESVRIFLGKPKPDPSEGR
ncbi:hypothetical protein LJR219_001525 [Phenylobacterium sp. LjRoot219]|uniref:hypothetical protein n=1 Tax=Phenylobacterium sp. LjRoot219 TaxID=3342283 RepID=UPI003ECFAE91